MPTVTDNTGTERQLRSVDWFNRAKAQYDANARNHVRLHPLLAVELPRKVSLRPQQPPVYDQLQIGSCTANGIAGIEEYQMIRQGLAHWTPARLQIYQQELDDQGDPQHTDEGATITESVQEGMQHGFAKESDYSYRPELLPQPIPAAIKALALKNRIAGAHPVAQDRNTIMAELAALNEINVGFLVHPGYEAVGGDGRVPDPAGGVLGGHDNVIIGYDLDFKNLDGSSGAYEMRNSWSGNWGDGGYCWQPMAAVENPNEFSDLQAVTAVQIGDNPTPIGQTVAMAMNVQPVAAIVDVQAPNFSVKMLRADGTLNTDDSSTVVNCQLAGWGNHQTSTAVGGIATFHGDMFTRAHAASEGLHYDFTSITLAGFGTLHSAAFVVTDPTPPPPPPPGPTDKAVIALAEPSGAIRHFIEQ